MISTAFGDKACAWAVVAAAALVLAAYAVRRAVRGELGFPRVEQAGVSAFLGRGPMVAVYWALQPAAGACVALGIGANAVTIGSLVLGAGAGVAVGAGNLGVGALLAAASSLGDALDGLVARRTRTASDAGEVLDAAVDRYTELFFLGGVAVLLRADPWLLTTTLAAMGGAFMVSYASAKAEALHVAAPRGAMRRPERAAYLTCGAALAAVLGISWPLLAAVTIVAVVAHAGAISRLRVLAASVQEGRS